MAMNALQRNELRECLAEKPDRILFATACGPLLFGFPRQAQYVDLRGVHLASPDHAPEASCRGQSREWREERSTFQIEWLSHEVGKFVRLLQMNNGGAYEQLFSPYEIFETQALGELRQLAQAMVSLQLVAHYRDVFGHQAALFRGQRDKHGRHFLYLFRLALTGLHLLERGQLQVDLRCLARFHERVTVLQLLDELDRQANVRDARPYLAELEALAAQLQRGKNAARLPELVPHRDQAEAWLARLREHG